MSWEDNEKEFQRLRNEKQDWYNGGYATGADSNLTPAETLGYYDLQKMSDDEYNKFSQAVKSNSSPTIDTSSIINDDKPGIGTAVMNGLKGSVRGLLTLILKLIRVTRMLSKSMTNQRTSARL